MATGTEAEPRTFSRGLLSPAQLAERLGVPVSWVHRRTAPSAPEAQALPHLKLGRHVRFDPDVIEAWIEDQKRGGGEEINLL